MTHAISLTQQLTNLLKRKILTALKIHRVELTELDIIRMLP